MDEWLDAINAEGQPPAKGYLTYTTSGGVAPSSGPPPEGATPTYQEVDPLRLLRKEGGEGAVWEFPDYDAALDVFFGKVEAQKEAADRAARERAAESKVERIREEQRRRAAALREEAEGETR